MYDNVQGGFPAPIRAVAAQLQRRAGDIFGNDFKTWSVQFQVSYPIGTSPADAGSRRRKLQREQQVTTLRASRLQVTAQVRDAARQVDTSLKRVEATRKAREFGEQALRGRAEAHHRRPVDDVPAVPGPARSRRPRSGGAERDHRLQPRAGELRIRAARCRHGER